MKFSSLPAPFVPPVIAGGLLPEQDEVTSEVSWMTSDTICMVNRGYMSAAITLRNMRKLQALMDYRAPRWLVIDAMAATGFDLIGRIALERQLTQFRKRGGEEVALSTPLCPLRMLVPAMSMVTRLPIRLFDSPREAFAHVQRLRRAGG